MRGPCGPRLQLELNFITYSFSGAAAPISLGSARTPHNWMKVNERFRGISIHKIDYCFVSRIFYMEIILGSAILIDDITGSINASDFVKPLTTLYERNHSIDMENPDQTTSVTKPILKGFFFSMFLLQSEMTALLTF